MNINYLRFLTIFFFNDFAEFSSLVTKGILQSYGRNFKYLEFFSILLLFFNHLSILTILIFNDFAEFSSLFSIGILWTCRRNFKYLDFLMIFCFFMP